MNVNVRLKLSFGCLKSQRKLAFFCPSLRVALAAWQSSIWFLDCFVILFLAMTVRHSREGRNPVFSWNLHKHALQANIHEGCRACVFDCFFRFSASFFLLCSQKKETKENATPVAACFLRFSLKRAAAELVLSALRQSSPKTSVLTAILGAAKGIKAKHVTS